MGFSIGKILGIVGAGAAIASGIGAFAAPGLAAGSVGSAFLPAALTGVAPGAGIAASAGGLFGSLGTIGSLLNTAGSVIGGIQSVAGAFAQPASTYMGAQSTAFQAKQAAANYLDAAENFDFQSSISKINATISKSNQIYEEQRAAAELDRMLRADNKVRQTARVAYAASGVRLTGSAVDVIADMANEQALNRALYKYESDQRVRGFQFQQYASTKEAENYAKAGVRAKENATSVLEEGLKASKGQTSLAFAQGLDAIPKALSGVNDLFKVFEAM